MTNKIEKFVQENREAFDNAKPVRDLWQDIRTEAVTPAPVKVFRMLTRTQVAAAILVLLNAAVIFYLFEYKQNSTAKSLPDTSQTEQPAAPAYEQQIDQIGKAVEFRQARLKEIEKVNPVLYKTFVQSLNQLNSNYKELEKDLSTNPNKEPLLEAMIQNLSLQLELLNQQLSIYQNLKKKKNENVSKNM